MFVECEEPLCASIGPAEDIWTEGYHQVWICEAGTETIDRIVPTFFAAVADAGRDFDMARMGVVIRRERRQILEALERKPTGSCT